MSDFVFGKAMGLVGGSILGWLDWIGLDWG
jgi:hypothetical protein